MSRKNNKTNKNLVLAGGELAAIERMIIQNAKPKTSKKSGKKQKQNKANTGNGGQRSQGIAFSNRQEKTKAQISRGANGSMRVVNREFIGNVTDLGTGFQLINRYRINAASQKTFRWLSTIAKAFENYKFRMLRFRYIPRCSTTSQGSILMLPDYDAADASPPTEIEACSHVNAVEEVIWEELVCVLKPESLNRAYKSHFNCTDTRFDGSVQDEKTLDAAQFFVFVESSSAGTDGKLWVEYDVELTTPQPPELDASLGGAGTLKVSGLNVNSANIFNDNVTSTNLQEEVPVLRKLTLTDQAYPNASMWKFMRDWEGFVTKEVTGTGITDGGAVKVNGVDVTTLPGFATTINSIGSGLAELRQIHGHFKEGDLLGAGPVVGTTLASMIMNLGGSSVL